MIGGLRDTIVLITRRLKSLESIVLFSHLGGSREEEKVHCEEIPSRTFTSGRRTLEGVPSRSRSVSVLTSPRWNPLSSWDLWMWTSVNGNYDLNSLRLNRYVWSRNRDRRGVPKTLHAMMRLCPNISQWTREVPWETFPPPFCLRRWERWDSHKEPVTLGSGS